jgi:hypothetical protein
MELNRRQFLTLTALASMIAVTDLTSIAVVAAESKEDKVVRIAKTFVGQDYNGYCLSLCNKVYADAGYPFKKYDNPVKAIAAMRSKLQGKSKKGCLMFWGTGLSKDGHAAIFLDDDKVLTSYTYYGRWNSSKKVSIVSHNTIKSTLPDFKGYLHIGDAISF